MVAYLYGKKAANESPEKLLKLNRKFRQYFYILAIISREDNKKMPSL